jgi:uncharacterized Zn-binding protein involved in type VI secretion
MRKFPPTAVALAAITLGAILIAPASAISQETSPFRSDPLTRPKRVLGLFDPQTGTFQALPPAVPDATVAPIAGTITVTVHITLKTAVATGDKVACTADLIATFSSTTGTATYSEIAGVFATVSGTTATCTLSIPHSWQFPAKTTTSIESLIGSYSADIINPTVTTAAQLLVRESSSSFVSLTGNNIFATAPVSFSVNATL